MNVVKDNPTLLVEGAGCEDAGDIRSHDPQAVPPSPCRLRVDSNRADVRERNVESAPERPKLIEALDVEMNAVTFDRDQHHCVSLQGKGWGARIHPQN